MHVSEGRGKRNVRALAVALSIFSISSTAADAQSRLTAEEVRRIIAQAASVAGTALTQRSAASGDKITPADNLMLIVTNGGVAEVDLTVAVPGNTAYGQPNPDVVATIAASGTEAIALLKEWADPSDGLIALTWESTTSVTYYVVRR